MPRRAGIAVASFAACLLLVAPAFAGTLGTVDTYDTGGFVFGTGIADFDRDGKTDLIVANDASAEGDHLSFLRGKGDGTFKRPRNIRDPRGPEGIVVARFNSDRLPDFAVADEGTSTVSIFMNRGDGKFKLARKLEGGPGNWLLESADMDDDGRLDLVSGNYDSDGSDSISMFLGKGGGRFEARRDAGTTANVSGLALGNLDQDTQIDAVTVDINGTIWVRHGDGDGGFEVPFDPPYDFTAGTVGWQVALGRFNAGDSLDLAVPLYSTDQVAVLLGNPAQEGTFDVAPIISPAGDGVNGIAGGDFDRDGDLDIAAGAFHDEGVRTLFGPGTGSFDCSDPAPGSEGTETIEVGRLDKDKRLDVVAGTDTGIDVFLGKSGAC